MKFNVITSSVLLVVFTSIPVCYAQQVSRAVRATSTGFGGVDGLAVYYPPEYTGPQGGFAKYQVRTKNHILQSAYCKFHLKLCEFIDLDMYSEDLPMPPATLASIVAWATHSESFKRLVGQHALGLPMFQFTS